MVAFTDAIEIAPWMYPHKVLAIAGISPSWGDTAHVATPAVTDGAAVGCIMDISGRDNHLIQATGANQPLLKLNVTNARPTWRLDGTDYLAVSSNDVAIWDKPYVMWAVVKNGVGDLDLMSTGGISANGSNLLMYFSSRFRAHQWSSTSSNVLDTLATYGSGNFHFVAQRVSNWGIYLTVDNLIEENKQAFVGTVSSPVASLYIGTRNGGGANWQSDIAAFGLVPDIGQMGINNIYQWAKNYYGNAF